MKNSNQTIECRVCSCEHHDKNDMCQLDCICVQPMKGGVDGDAASETLCGSYRCESCK